MLQVVLLLWHDPRHCSLADCSTWGLLCRVTAAASPWSGWSAGSISWQHDLACGLTLSPHQQTERQAVSAC